MAITAISAALGLGRLIALPFAGPLSDKTGTPHLNRDRQRLLRGLPDWTCFRFQRRTKTAAIKLLMYVQSSQSALHLEPVIAFARHTLPLFDLNLGWILPSLVGALYWTSLETERKISRPLTPSCIPHILIV